MSTWRVWGFHYTHHEQEVREVLAELVSSLNRDYALGFQEPVEKKEGIWPFRRKRIISTGEGARIEATCRDEHSNDLYLRLNITLHNNIDLADMTVAGVRDKYPHELRDAIPVGSR